MNNSKNCWTVYCHNTPSGKRYIGITSQKPEKRWHNGRGYKNTLFGRAIEKYGWENIKHEILDTELDEFTAKCLEEYYIFSYQTYIGFKDDCKGYNLTIGGDGQVGFKHTEETKRKLSESHKGKTSHKGYKNSEETRKKISESNKGQTPWNKGIPHTEESKMKMSESHKGKTSGMKGKHHTEESRRKNSESNKGKTPWNIGISKSEETRRKQSEAMKGKHWKLIDGKRVYF